LCALVEGTYGYGFLVPFFNGAANYSGQLARLDLEVPSTAFANPSSKFSQGNFDGQLHSYDLTFIDSELKGFMGGFSANRNLTTLDGSTIARAHGYLVPFYNDEAGHFGKVVKVDLDNFGYLQTACTGYPSSSNIVKTELGNFTCFGDGEGSLVSVLDLTEYDDDLRGFMGGFEGEGYGFLVPHHKGFSCERAIHPPPPAGPAQKGVGEKLLGCDGDAYSGKLVRFDLGDFKTVDVIDLEKVHRDLVGFNGAFTAGRYAFLVPYRRSSNFYSGYNLMPTCNGLVAKIDMITLDVTYIDLTVIKVELCGFAGGFSAGRYGFLVPYYNGQGTSGYHGQVVRFDVAKFSLESVQILDLGKKDVTLKGFHGGFASAQYGYFVPWKNGLDNYKKRQQTSKLVRVDLTTFQDVDVIDLSMKSRNQLPPTPDRGLRGFVGGAAGGDFVYLSPHFNGEWFGKVVRLSTKEDDLQFIDLIQVSDTLSGFSGMFIQKNELKDLCLQDRVFYTGREYLHCSPACDPMDGHPGPNRYVAGRYGKVDKSCE